MSFRLLCAVALGAASADWAPLEKEMTEIYTKGGKVALDEFLSTVDFSKYMSIELKDSAAEASTAQDFSKLYLNVVLKSPEFEGAAVVAEEHVPASIKAQFEEHEGQCQAQQISLGDAEYHPGYPASHYGYHLPKTASPTMAPKQCTGRDRCNETPETGVTTPLGIFKNADVCPSGILAECSTSTPLGALCYNGPGTQLPENGFQANWGTAVDNAQCPNTVGVLVPENPDLGAAGFTYGILKKISCKRFFYKCPFGQFLQPIENGDCVFRWVAIRQFVPCPHGHCSYGCSSGKCSCGVEKIFWTRKLLCPCECVNCPTFTTTTAPTTTTSTSTTTTDDTIFCLVDCQNVVYQAKYTSNVPETCVKAVENTLASNIPNKNACPCAYDYTSHDCGCRSKTPVTYGGYGFKRQITLGATGAEAPKCCGKTDGWSINEKTLEDHGVLKKAQVVA